MFDLQGNVVKLNVKADADIAFWYKPITTVQTDEKERFDLTLGSLKHGYRVSVIIAPI
jgi:fructose/tagatose bisphosphate aldolase